MPPKRKAPPKLSGLVGSDDEEIMETTAKEPETSNEPPAKRRRGRPRTSHENVTEIKSTKPATRTKKQQPAANEPEAPTDKKSTRRGRPRGSRAAQDAEMPAQEAMEETIPEYDSVHDEKGEPPTINESSKQPPKAAKAKAAAPTRGRGRGRAVSAQLHTDGGFEFTPSSARQGDHHVADKEQAASPLGHMETREGEDPEVEDSHPIEEPATELVDETPSYKHKAASPVKSGRSRLSILRNPQDSSPRKRKLGGIGGTDSEHGGDPELRRRLGDMAKKHEALESKFRNLREIGVVEANTNMEKLRKQNENIVTGTSLSLYQH